MNDTRLQAAPGALDKLARAALALAGVALVVMAAAEAWQVFARYVLNDSPSWTEPVALLCMSTTMMLGAAAGVHGRRHFGFFLLAELAPLPLRLALLALGILIETGVGLLLAGWGVAMLADGWSWRMAGAPLPQGIVYLPICVGGALIALFAAARGAATLRARGQEV